MELIKKKLSELKPYKNNPRRNDAAVEAVMESIRQCSYISPIIVDENMEILAGHTRYKALRELGYRECDVIVKDGLTDEQKRKYRLLDNKTNELAGWDFELLDAELIDLDFDGYDFGFEIADDIDIDSLFGEDSKTKEKKKKVITCPHCGEEFELE